MVAQRRRILFLWHMHQPTYCSPVSGEYVLPWVLVHAMRDYLDVPEIVASHPNARATINLVPGLLRQLEEYAREEARDLFLAAAMKPPGELDESERRFLVENFFNVHPETMLEPYPRYAELAYKARPLGASVEKVLERFSDQELLDLQMWFFLTWTGPTLRAIPEIAELFVRGRDFTQEDKETLRQAVLALLRRTIPRLRELAESGRIEVSASPLYHPILPLLIDTDTAREARPDSPLPLAGFVFPEDARRQVRRGLDELARLMGRPVAGMWPSEGAICERSVRVMAEQGVEWLASDEKLLMASVGEAGKGRGRADLLYRPWRSRGMTVFFRDAVLSDLIGFVYPRWDTDAAVEHFVGEVLKATERAPQEAPVVTIAMDGENAWEYYLAGGHAFLRCLVERLASDERFELVTPSQVAAEGGGEELPRIASGSWIDGTFSTWLGDPVKNRAWEHLAAARQMAAQALSGGRLAPREAAALEDLILRAEASDWFWWFGRGHTSPYDAEFDELFRQHLRAMYRLLGMHPPDALEHPLDKAERVTSRLELPVHLISPGITGKQDRYYKWISAGRMSLEQGFLHRPRLVVREVRFGFDRERLYFRVESGSRLLRRMRDGRLWLTIHFLKPLHRDMRIWVDTAGVAHVTCLDSGKECPATEVAIGTVVEVAVPFAVLQGGERRVEPGTEVACRIMVSRRGREIERFPQTENLAFVVRGEDLDAENWHV